MPPSQPLGARKTLVEHGKAREYVKVRMDGPQRQRWMPLSHWEYLQQHGQPPPKGMYVLRQGDKLVLSRTSRPELPLGSLRTVRERGRAIQQIKVAMTGPDCEKWMRLSRWRYLQRHGSVPAGKRVVEYDGELLAVTSGEVAILFDANEKSHQPEVHARRVKTLQSVNRWRAEIEGRRQIQAIRWYAVDHARRCVVRRPFVSRAALLRHYGFDVKDSKNGGVKRSVLAACPVEPVLGSRLRAGEFADYGVMVPGTQESISADAVLSEAGD